MKRKKPDEAGENSKNKKNIQNEASGTKGIKYSNIGSIVWATKKLWRLDKGILLLALATAPVDVAVPLVGTYFTKVLIDHITGGTAFGGLCVLLLIFGLLQLLLNAFQHILKHRCFARRYYATLTYQEKMEEVLDYQTDYENIEKQDFQKILGYAQKDANYGSCSMEFIWEDLAKLLKDSLGIVTYASLIMALNPVIFAVVAVTSVLSYFTARWQPAYQEKNKHRWEKEERKKNYLQSFSDDFGAAKDIKLYGLEGWLESMMRDYQAYLLMWKKRCSLRGLWAAGFAGLMTLLQNGTAYFVLIGLLLKGGVTVGSFVFYFGITGSIAGFLRGIVEDMAKLSSRADKINYYRRLFNYPSRYNHGPGCGLPDCPVRIEFKDVWYKYDGAEDYTLKGVTMTLEPGESLALVGVNGAGKTTLIKLLCGLYTPSRGEILVGGRRISEYNIEEYYSLISAVFQESGVVPFTVFEFVASSDLDRPAARESAVAAMKAADIWDRIESLPGGMDVHLQKGVFEDGVDLSGGEQQKLYLARAIYKDGTILILDEPTAALDPIAENGIYLQYHALTAGKTSIYISHRLASTRFCDRIVFLEDGQIRESGTHEELMRCGGRYAHMFEVQSKYYKEEGDEQKSIQ